MSWRSYQVLTPQPDFSVEPVVGVMDSGRILTELGQAPAFAEWRGDTPLALGFSWRLQSAAEFRTFVEFMNSIGGKSTPFFLPSWAPDFELAAPTAIGDVEIRVKAAGFVDITQNRPDTDGRQIFIVSTDARFQACSVIGAVADGDEEILSLDFPIAYVFTPAEAIVGRLRLVRLADDRIEYETIRPGNTLVPLRVVTTRQTRHVSEAMELQGAQQFALKPFADVLCYDEDPEKTTFTTAEAIGPETYGFAQSINFYRPWTASIEGTVVTLRSSESGSVPIPSVLYDSAFTSAHIAFGFDAGGNESLAWETERNSIRIGWKSGGIEQWLNFTGISPVMFQTWEIDSTSSAGDSELVVFYIREGYSGIFARFYRENFAIERLVAVSPTAPIYLQAARSNGGKIEVVGMDAGHRRCIWRAGDYVPPLEFQSAFFSLAGVSMNYVQINVQAVAPDESKSTFRLASVSGAYVSTRIYSTSPDDSKSTFRLASVSGAYVSIRVYSTSPDDSKSTFRLSGSIPGEYRLIASRTTADDAKSLFSLKPQITGTYGPP